MLIQELSADITTILWVLLAVMVVIACVVCVAGKLGDVFGQAFLFNTGFAVFTLGNLLGGFSQPASHGADLLAYRCVIGARGSGRRATWRVCVCVRTTAMAPPSGASARRNDTQQPSPPVPLLCAGLGAAFLFTNSSAIITDSFAPYGQVRAPVVPVCGASRNDRAIRRRRRQAAP